MFRMTPIPRLFDVKNPTKPELYHNVMGIPGMPIYWRNDVTGRLQLAVEAYCSGAMTGDQVEILIAYIQHHIHAPIWIEHRIGNNGIADEARTQIEELRKLSMELKSLGDIADYISKAMDLALDPL